MSYEFERKQRLAVLGGGPGGYEAALAGAQLGADVTIVERSGVGGSAVITDVVPSKSLIATAEATNSIGEATDLGVQFFSRGETGKPVRPEIAVNLAAVNKRLVGLARQQSEDMRAELVRSGVRIVTGEGRLDGAGAVVRGYVEGAGQRVLGVDGGLPGQAGTQHRPAQGEDLRHRYDGGTRYGHFRVLPGRTRSRPVIPGTRLAGRTGRTGPRGRRGGRSGRGAGCAR